MTRWHTSLERLMDAGNGSRAAKLRLAGETG
jgi:hypothetical protein